MLKVLHKDDTLTSPFVATKDWSLSNITNIDVILMEHSGSSGLPVGVEYLSFGPNSVVTASNCDVALEQQSSDLATYRDGLNVPGLFYPDTDPQNADGTYQRMVYSQVVNMFYNTYRDPTKIWGLEQIDFDLSQTKRFIADKFKMFQIPTVVYGEKILPNSVVLYDDTTDNNYTITDDGNCNLFAGPNLFSSQQELGEFVNEFLTGSTNYCDVYDTVSIPDPPVMTITYELCVPAIDIIWNMNDWNVTSYVVEKSTDGINFSQSFNGIAFSYYDTAVSYNQMYWYQMYAVNLIGTSSYSFSSSIYTYNPNVWNVDTDTWDATGNSCSPSVWDTGSI